MSTSFLLTPQKRLVVLLVTIAVVITASITLNAYSLLRIIKPTAPHQTDNLPLSFVPNVGQSDPTVFFQARDTDVELFFMLDRVELSIPETSSTDAAKLVLRFRGAHPTQQLLGAERLPGSANYFIGNDPANWRSNVPTYKRVLYKGLYPGIDLRYEGSQGTLKGTYTIAPGGDPTHIHWTYEGVKEVQIDETTNDLIITLAASDKVIIEPAPVAWQIINGLSVSVEAHYVIAADGSINFALGTYDRNYPVILDPTLTYSTYFGGNFADRGYDLALDNSGNIYITGETNSSNFPVVNPVQGFGGGTCQFAIPCEDVFITKMNPSGSAVIYSTYLGGSNLDTGYSIAVDSAGNAYVTGKTVSSDFPITNALQSTGSGPSSAFVAKLNADGNGLIYSTYLDGNGTDAAKGIAVDSGGNAFIVGQTTSSDFPVVNSIQANNGGSYDAFVAKLNGNGSALVYSSYLGNTGYDEGTGIVIDTSGNAYIVGMAGANFPVVNPIQANYGGGNDAFVAKLNADGSALVYSTYLGGSSLEDSYDIAVDSNHNAYVVGQTYSADFPVVNPIQGTNHGGYDLYVAKLNPNGNALVFSTYLGGSAYEGALASSYDPSIAADSDGNSYIIGQSDSTDFPTLNAMQNTNAGDSDVIIAKLNANGCRFYSTYLGGNGDDTGNGIAVDNSNNAYIMGMTTSTNFPVVNPLQANNAAGADVFISKLSSQDEIASCPAFLYLPSILNQ